MDENEKKYAEQTAETASLFIAGFFLMLFSISVSVAMSMAIAMWAGFATFGAFCALMAIFFIRVLKKIKNSDEDK